MNFSTLHASSAQNPLFHMGKRGHKGRVSDREASLLNSKPEDELEIQMTLNFLRNAEDNDVLTHVAEKRFESVVPMSQLLDVFFFFIKTNLRIEKFADKKSLRSVLIRCLERMIGQLSGMTITEVPWFFKEEVGDKFTVIAFFIGVKIALEDCDVNYVLNGLNA